MTRRHPGADASTLGVFDYDTRTAGVLNPDQLAAIQSGAITAPDDEPYAPARPDAYVPARAGRELPAMPVLSAEQDDANFALASAQALSAGAGGVFEHTSASDRTRANLLQSAGYAGFGAVAVIGGAAAWWWNSLPWSVVACVGAFGVIAMALVHVASLRHSQSGVARLKVGTVRGMARDRLNSRERLAREMTRAWVQLAESSWDHEERMEKEKRRARK